MTFKLSFALRITIIITNKAYLAKKVKMLKANNYNGRMCGKESESFVHVLAEQCRSKGNISGGAREALGGCGGMLPQKILKSRGLEMLFPAFSKSYL